MNLKKNFFRLCYLLFFYLFTQGSFVIDKVIARVNDKFILDSDLQEAYDIANRNSFSPFKKKISKSELLNNLIKTQALLCKAERSDIKINKDNVNLAVNANFSHYVNTLGSVSKVEEYFQKSSFFIKRELKKKFIETNLIEELKRKELREVDICPSDVFKKFSEFSEKELFIVEDKYELYYIAKIVKPLSIDIEDIISTLKIHKYNCEKEKINEFLNLSSLDFKESNDIKIEKGKHSWKIGSSEAPSYEEFALQIAPNKISFPISTEKGAYLMRVVSRNLKNIEVEYIFVPYTIKEASINSLTKNMINIKNKIESKEITFEKAFKDCSELINDQNIFSSKLLLGKFLKKSDLSEELLDAIDNQIIIEGKVSKPILINGKFGTKILAIFYLKKKIPEHVVNVDSDFKKIKNFLLEKAKKEKIDKLIEDCLSEAYIYIDSEYCC